jgi:hypothetical protein
VAIFDPLAGGGEFTGSAERDRLALKVKVRKMQLSTVFLASCDQPRCGGRTGVGEQMTSPVGVSEPLDTRVGDRVDTSG